MEERRVLPFFISFHTKINKKKPADAPCEIKEI